MNSSSCKTDIGALVLLEKDGEPFWLSPGTLAQCLAIAAREHRRPQMDEGWERAAVPAPLRPGANDKEHGAHEGEGA